MKVTLSDDKKKNDPIDDFIQQLQGQLIYKGDSVDVGSFKLEKIFGKKQKLLFMRSLVFRFF